MSDAPYAEPTPEDDPIYFDASLFLNRQYEEKTFTVGPHTIRLLVSPSACTDFDLTGQVLWPAAQLLAGYLAAHPQLLEGWRGACELGAGLGLAGLTASRHCPVVLTDHNEEVLSVLQCNAALNSDSTSHEVRCMLCEWTSPEDLAAVRAAGPSGGYDVIIGADICYGQQALPAVFSAAAALMAPSAASRFLLGYVSRAAAIDASLAAAANQSGLALAEVPGTRQDVGGSLEGWICEGTWSPDAAKTVS